MGSEVERIMRQEERAEQSDLLQTERLYDSRGVPIYPGDLLRTFHFRGARRKKYWLYHVAVMDGGVMWAVPTSHLEPTKRDGGGRCMLKYLVLDKPEVIAGHGPGDTLSFEDRPRKAAAGQEVQDG